MIGTIISGYRIVRQVGKGGMGVVYKAVNEQIARTTAIKVLNPRYCQDAETVQRLMNEARAVNIVGHPGLINIHEFGQLEDGSGYLIMEFLDGDTRAVAGGPAASGSPSRSPRRWRQRMNTGLCTAISSPRTSCWSLTPLSLVGCGQRFSILASPSSRP